MGAAVDGKTFACGLNWRRLEKQLLPQNCRWIDANKINPDIDKARLVAMGYKIADGQTGATPEPSSPPAAVDESKT